MTDLLIYGDRTAVDLQELKAFLRGHLLDDIVPFWERHDYAFTHYQCPEHGEWRDDLARHPLIRYAREHEHCVITPHIGGVTFESQAMVCDHTARLLINFFESL